LEQSVLAEICLQELGNSKTVGEARHRIEENCGHAFTTDSLYSYLRRRGLKAPSEYLSVSIPIDTSAFSEESLGDAYLSAEQLLGKYYPDTVHADKPETSYDWEPLDCGKELERILLIPDTHRPFHEKRAWAAMIAYAKKLRPHSIRFLGDYQDFYSVSSHDRDPRRGHQLSDEISDGQEGLDEVDDLGAERVMFHAGNHCDRLSRYLMQHAQALLGITGIPEVLRLAERGWQYVPYLQHARIGKLYTTHDVGFSGVNAVRQTGAAFRHSVAFGHSHRLAVDYFGTVTGDRYVSANLGWLGDPDAADYCHQATKTAWQHGFGVAYMEKSGLFQIEAIPIVDGRIIKT
jgi:hypothetical protein